MCCSSPSVFVTWTFLDTILSTDALHTLFASYNIIDNCVHIDHSHTLDWTSRFESLVSNLWWYCLWLLWRLDGLKSCCDIINLKGTSSLCWAKANLRILKQVFHSCGSSRARFLDNKQVHIHIYLMIYHCYCFLPRNFVFLPDLQIFCCYNYVNTKIRACVIGIDCWLVRWYDVSMRRHTCLLFLLAQIRDCVNDTKLSGTYE